MHETSQEVTRKLLEFAEVARKALPAVQKPGLQWAMEQPDLVKRSGTWCEFGVHGGSTLRYINQQKGEAKLWGFDSFKGLPEDWNKGHKKGVYRLEHPPMPPEGVNFMVGWFNDTVPSFYPSAPVTFAHIDCDLYSSAKVVLNWLVPRHLGEGAVLVFDDFFTAPIDNGVMRALHEVAGRGLTIDWLANPASGNARSDVAVVRLSVRAG